MIDWGIALAVGLGVAFASEVTILGAILFPKIPVKAGRTWRGTVTAVSAISIIIGGVGGYIAGQFGGRGGGGAVAPGSAAVSTQSAPAAPVATSAIKPQETRPIRPAVYLANTVDLYFVRDTESKLVANFKCEVVSYRRQGDTWVMTNNKVTGKTLEEFLKLNNELLSKLSPEIPENDRPTKRLRVFLDPFPGDLTFEQLRRLAEAQGWKVDRKDVAWQPDYPASQ